MITPEQVFWAHSAVAVAQEAASRIRWTSTDRPYELAPPTKKQRRSHFGQVCRFVKFKVERQLHATLLAAQEALQTIQAAWTRAERVHREVSAVMQGWGGEVRNQWEGAVRTVPSKAAQDAHGRGQRFGLIPAGAERAP